jgi:hypothetical protein
MRQTQAIAALEYFYAATVSLEVYQIQLVHKGGKVPWIKKIADNGMNPVLLGKKFDNGSMVGITRSLQLFVPEGGGLSSFEREILRVNTRYWGYATPEIAALFFSKNKALHCLEKSNLRFCDGRFKDGTRNVLKRIGENHLCCSISTSDPNFWLLPPDEWQ